MNSIIKMQYEHKVLLILNYGFRRVLRYLNSDINSLKIDVAFKRESGLYIYSLIKSLPDNEDLINQTIIEEDTIDASLYSAQFNYSDLSKIISQYKDNNTQKYKIRSLGRIDLYNGFAYAMPFSDKESFNNVELIDELFSAFIENLKNKLSIDTIQQNFINLDYLIESENSIAKRGFIYYLSKTLFRKRDYKRAEMLYDSFCLLSSSAYEKAQNKGRIWFLNENTPNNKSYITFNEPIKVNRDNVRHIRKLIEMSNDKNVLVIKEDSVIGINSQSQFSSGTGIAFHGNGKWELFTNNNHSVISFNSVVFELKDQALNKKLEISLRHEFRQKCDVKKIVDIVEEAKKQSHGTTLIISEDAINESIRLSKLNRAIQIRETEINKDTILSLTAIDGALLLNPYGICYAIGVILDGESVSKGNMSRGARYNSAVTYIDYWKSKTDVKAIAVIISADDSTDYYSGND